MEHGFADDFDGGEAGVLGGADAVADALETIGDAGDAGEDGGVDGVHADGDAVEAGSAQRAGTCGAREVVAGREWGE